MYMVRDSLAEDSSFFSCPQIVAVSMGFLPWMSRAWLGGKELRQHLAFKLVHLSPRDQGRRQIGGGYLRQCFFRGRESPDLGRQPSGWGHALRGSLVVCGHT